jgi:hypothetical protein
LADVAQIRAEGTRCIEDCRGDFAEVSRLIETSWAENKQQPLLYGADFLVSCFEYPGASLSLAPTLYEGEDPLAFVAAFPRRVLLQGRELNLAVITFLTVATECKKRGYGIVLWNELVKRIRAAGFDGMVNYCIEGESMDSMILGCCRALQLPTARAHSVPYWSRMLQPPKVRTDLPGPASDSVERFLELASRVAERTPLTRVWSREEADWQCCRFGAIVSVLEAGSRRGMLTGYVIPVADPRRTKCLMVEDILWGDLEPNERETLVKMLLERAVSAGAQVAVLPVLGYADAQPFHAARFRPSQRVLHAYLSVWNGELASEPLASMYLDVF